VVSTDPAHSLGDALGVPLSARPQAVRPRLHAVELDAPRAFARWLAENRRALEEILEHGTWLDRTDIEALLDLRMPGVDELMGLIEIDRLALPRSPDAESPRRGSSSSARGGRRPAPAGGRPSRPGVAGAAADLIVVDTAPTGHTMRLLTAPEAVAAVSELLDALQEEHRLIREQLARVGRPEAADHLIALLARQARETAARLRDPAQTACCWVTLPETLSIAETEDALAALEKAGIPVPEIVVNRVIPDEGPCPICDRRRAEERRAVAAIRRTIGRSRRVRVIPAEINEPRSVRALARIGQLLTAARAASGDRRAASMSRAPGRGRADRTTRLRRPAFSSTGERTVTPAAVTVLRDARLLFFGGKGGVGKTTVAAAAALSLARANPTRRLLLLSTDPAHSLGDVFAATIGDAPRRLTGAPGNLFVREMDAQRALAARRAELESALSEIASTLGAAELGASGGSELLNLAPPGIDELFGILFLARSLDPRGGRGSNRSAPRATSSKRDSASPRRYDTVIVDAAPTGHALRLLEMPDAAREWVQVLLRVLLKYRALVRPGQLAAELVDVSKSIRMLQALFRDGDLTRFIVVTRAAEVPRVETERLLDRLRRLGLATPALVVNAMTLAPGVCRRCRATAKAEQAQLVALGRRLGGRVIIQTPLSAPPPRGVPALDRWSGTWIA
jgi:arsenite-transporting ATPase